LVSKLVVMDNGQIVVQGEKDTVIRQLQDNSVAEGKQSHA
jgi:ABC-type glutathione transport system ATPase component